MIFLYSEIQQYSSDIHFLIYSWSKMRNTSQVSLVGDLRGTATFRDESLSYIPAEGVALRSAFSFKQKCQWACLQLGSSMAPLKPDLGAIDGWTEGYKSGMMNMMKPFSIEQQASRAGNCGKEVGTGTE